MANLEPKAQIQEEPRIDRMFSELEGYIYSLKDLVNSLERSLGAVLTPCPPQTPNKDTRAMPMRSPLTERIDNNAQDVHNINNQIREILERIDC